VRSVWLTTQAALPFLQAAARAGGPGATVAVINLTSIAGARPMTGLGPYCAAKAAADMLTRVQALELAPRGIRVVAVAPGTVATAFHEHAGMSAETAAAYYAASAGTHPIGRVGVPADVAELVAFLADGSKASFITGQTYYCDGGRLLTSSTAPQLASAGSSSAGAAAAPQAAGQ
jgi:NAD(P)-dependent dehydrogenase (short-subunit alcohol dehydrogenase family)